MGWRALTRSKHGLGLSDEEQLIYAGKEKATIFTHDTDFIQIAVKWVEEGGTHHGIIYCHQKKIPDRRMRSKIEDADSSSHLRRHGQPYRISLRWDQS